jgi:serine/threonine protein kinase
MTSNEPELRPDDPRGAPPTAAPGMSEASPSPQLQTVSIDGYTLLHEIARGGQGAVYDGVRKSTGRRVAIKVLTGGAFIGPRERARFEREVQILAALDHPNIVHVIDRGTTADGSLFLVMDFVTGRPLDQFLHAYYHKHPEGPPLADPSELLRMFMKICDAVNAAHLRGVVHRDLKPSNIRITESGDPYILDFGLARAAFSSAGEDGQMVSMTGQFLGTLAYASPEQAEGSVSKIDSRTDVYSLGVILYQMLTRRFPYEVAGTMREVLNNIVNSEPTPPSEVIADRPTKSADGKRRLHVRDAGKINAVLEAIILKALAKDRHARYQSAGELARDMANYLSGRPTIAAGMPPSIWQLKGTKRVAAVVVLLLLGCIGSIAWSLHGRRGIADVTSDRKPSPLTGVATTAALPASASAAAASATPVATPPPSRSTGTTAMRPAADLQSLIPTISATAGTGLAGWAIAETRSGKLEILRDSSVHRNGSASLCLRSVNGAADGLAAVDFARVPTSPFLVQGFLKSLGRVEDISLGVQTLDAQGKTLAWRELSRWTPDPVGRWFGFRVESTVPPTAAPARVRLGIHLKGDGLLWIDELSVHAYPERLPDAPVLTRAGLLSPPTGKTVVDLLPLIDLANARGRWSRGAAGITVDTHADGVVFVLVPYEPPAEYDFILDFTPLDADTAIAQNLTKDKTHFYWSIGSPLTGFGFGDIRAQGIRDNESTVLPGNLPQPGTRHISEVHIRNDSIAGFLDGRLVSECKTDYSDINDMLRMPLSVVAEGGRLTIHALRLVEVSGHGSSTMHAPVVKNQTADGTIQLDAADARLFGGLRLEGDAPRHTDWWDSAKCFAEWKVQVEKPGDFTATFNYAGDSRIADSEYELVADGKPLAGKINPTSNWADYKLAKAGTLHIDKPGLATITLKTTNLPRGSFMMNVRSITLTPVP